MKKNFIKIPLYIQILIGMLMGIVWGLFAVKWNLVDFTHNWIRPWGTIFIKALKLVAVPLVFLSLIKGITSMSDMAKLSNLGGKTILFYITTTVFAIIIGLTVANTLKPGNTFPKDQRSELIKNYNNKVKTIQKEAGQIKDKPILQPIVDIVPDNIVSAASNNRLMLQIIFFAVLFGISMVLVGEEKVKSLKIIIDSLDAVIIKIIDIIMLFAPYGTMALLTGLIVDFSGDVALFKALGFYVISVLIALFLLITIFYPGIILIWRTVKLKDFFKVLLPVQITAFSTSSSAATLPVTMSQAINKMKIPKNVAEFVLPVGVTINMDGTACYQAVAAVFIAQVMGIDLTLLDQIAIVLTALASSIGTPGIPGGSIIIIDIHGKIKSVI